MVRAWLKISEQMNTLLFRKMAYIKQELNNKKKAAASNSRTSKVSIKSSS
jgi:hypothetical protein